MSCTLTGLLVLAVLSASITESQGQALVIFGDSLSATDYGPQYIKELLNTDEVYPAPPYYEGRWSNGPVWAEDVADALNVPLLDYAIGGASTGSTPANSNPIFPPFANLTQPFPYQAPSIQDQVGFFLADYQNMTDPNDVYVIAAGANDIFLSLTVNTSAPLMADFVAEAVQKLYEAGARKFVLIAPPNPSIVPALAVTPYASPITSLALEYLVELTGLSVKLPTELPGASAEIFDFGGAVLQVLTNATGLGITNTTTCHIPSMVTLNGQSYTDQGSSSGYLCPDADSHFTWDGTHPTRPVHAAVARLFVRDIGPVFWGKQPASV